MQQRPLLPPLKEDHAVSNISDAGAWVRRDAAELDRIIQSLQVADSGSDLTNIDSIPYMWARPLLFEMALYDKDHPLHRNILAEWRGLLAILALREWYHFPTDSMQVEISSVEDTPEFIRALYRLLPHFTIDPNTTWNQVDLILFNGKAIGITSPTTLVCTAADYLAAISGVDWYDGRRLIDPVENLNDDARNDLAGWLKNLHNTLDNTLRSQNQQNRSDERIMSRRNALSGVIQDFIQDLGVEPAMQITFATNRIAFAQSLYRDLGRPVKPKDFPSSVRLVASRTPSPNSTLLVVDEAIAEEWNVDPYNVVVWGPTTLANYQTFGGDLQVQLPQNVQLRKPEGLFTDKLHVVGLENAFHDTLHLTESTELEYQGSLVSPILPIRSELLDYLDVNDLNDRIAFHQQDNVFVVTIRLTLSGINESHQDFVISHEYRAEDGQVVLIPSLPILEIWPNFHTASWSAYYTYFNTAGQDTFSAEPRLQAVDSFAFDTFTVTKTDRMPEGLICKYQEAEAGILLVSAEEISPDDSDGWTIGVDFGTTSTTVYRKEQDREPRPMSFEPRLLRITNSSERNRLYDDFLPPEQEETPFLSLFQTFGRTPTNKNEPLLDGHIYFLADYDDFRAAGNIVPDLKWSPRPQDRVLTRVFLKQLCLQCTAEAVVRGATEIDWRFSFPAAFSKADEAQFQNICQSVVSDCADLTGSSVRNINFELESIVAPRFFERVLQSDAASGAFATGAVCIDIGGETSDISVWRTRQRSNPFWQTSIRLAGRHIFLDLLMRSPAVLELLEEEAIENTNDRYYAQADALIKTKGNQWLQDLPTNAGEPEVKTFVQLVATGISGLLYYVGLVIRFLSQSREFEPRMPSIYLAGNGSRILHWLAHGSFGHQNPSKALLKQVLLDATGFTDEGNFDIEISINPKHETAYGLVADGARLGWDDEDRFGTLSGEAFTEQEQDYEWTEILTAERLASGLHISNRLEHIENFVSSFNRRTGPGEVFDSALEFNADDKNFIYEQLENHLNNLQRGNIHEMHVEPLFIVALKLLLDRKLRSAQD